MHVCIIFYNVGAYHLARLEAAREACEQQGWQLSAIQIVGSTGEHPWGDIALPSYVTTLLPFQEGDRPSLEDAGKLVRVLGDTNPDVVAIPGWGSNFARTALHWCRRHNKRRVLMCESKYDDAPRHALKEFWKKWRYVRHFDSALVGGQKHADYVSRLGMSPDQIFYRYDVVDTAYLASEVDRLRAVAAADQTGSGARRPCIISANRFIPRKNLLTLIDAFACSVSNNRESWDLVLLGAGEQESVLRQRAVDHGLQNRVLFPGFCTYTEIPRWYAAAEIFVHPARTEQWGLVVNEAMAARLPIILSNTCGCHPDLLEEGKNGLSFFPENTDLLSQHLSTLMDDPKLRHEMGQRSRDLIVEQFSPAKFGGGLCEAVQAAITGRKRTPAMSGQL